jgi:rhodanese-related sulfurtransferase
MRHWLVQVIIILLLSTVLAVAINAVRGGGIALIGKWPSGHGSGEVIVPPNPEPGDPPYIGLEDALMKYQSPDIIFIDSRSPEDFAYGHIAKAINVPFDYLDEQWDAMIDSLDKDRGYVIYCSGDECETSLHLGRYFRDRGFPLVFVFFGGWREWEAAGGLPIERATGTPEGGA